MPPAPKYFRYYKRNFLQGWQPSCTSVPRCSELDKYIKFQAILKFIRETSNVSWKLVCNLLNYRKKSPKCGARKANLSILKSDQALQSLHILF